MRVYTVIPFNVLRSLRPWDPLNDVVQYEHNYIIQTRTRHRTPIVRTTSISNVDAGCSSTTDPTGTRNTTSSRSIAARASIKRLAKQRKVEDAVAAVMGGGRRGSGSSTPDLAGIGEEDGDESDSSDDLIGKYCIWLECIVCFNFYQYVYDQTLMRYNKISRQ